jgi:hypothetical protein
MSLCSRALLDFFRPRYACRKNRMLYTLQLAVQSTRGMNAYLLHYYIITQSFAHLSLCFPELSPIYGREMTLPGDLDLDPKTSIQQLTVLGEELLEDLLNHFKSVRQTAHLHDLISKEKTLERAKQPLRPEITIDVGDIVFIKNMGHRTKFDDRLRGPYRVLKTHGVTYHLEEINSKSGKPSRIFQFHRALIRSVQKVADPAWLSVPISLAAQSAPESASPLAEQLPTENAIEIEQNQVAQAAAACNIFLPPAADSLVPPRALAHSPLSLR